MIALWRNLVDRHVQPQFGLARRMARALAASVLAAPALARLAIRDAAVLRQTVRRWEGRSLAYSFPLTSLYVLFVGGSILRAIPRLAGKADRRFFERVCAVHAHYQSKLQRRDLVLLTDATARQWKREHIIFEFRRTLGLNMEEHQAELLSNCAQTGELLRDFLDRCLTSQIVTATNIRVVMASALPEFGKERTIFGPVADRSLTGYYDRGYDLVEHEVFASLIEDHRDEMESHIKEGLAEFGHLTFDSVLLCEAHLCACLYFGGKLRRRSYLPPGFVTVVLERLKANLADAMGRKRTKRITRS